MSKRDAPPLTGESISAWIEANIASTARRFGLGNWRIQILFERLECNDDFQVHMRVDKKWQYERASIKIDAEALARDCESMFDVLESLEHEMMHIAHSPFDALHQLVMETGSLSQDFRDAFHESFMAAQELAVRNMERMTKGLRNP